MHNVIKKLKKKQERFLYERKIFNLNFKKIWNEMEDNIKSLNLFLNCDKNTEKYNKRKHEISVLQDEDGNLIVAYHKKGMKIDMIGEE